MVKILIIHSKSKLVQKNFLEMVISESMRDKATLLTPFDNLLILTDRHVQTHTHTHIKTVLYVNKDLRTLIISVSHTYVYKYTFCEKEIVQGEIFFLLVCHVFISGVNIRFL